MEIDNDAQVQRLRRMLATLSARDMSQTGFEAQIRHQKRIEQVRRAYDAVAGAAVAVMQGGAGSRGGRGGGLDPESSGRCRGRRGR